MERTEMHMEEHLTHNPQIVFFRNMYRRHTPSTPDVVKLHATSDGRYCVSCKHGDLLLRIFIVFYGRVSLADDIATLGVEVRSGSAASIAEQFTGLDLEAEQSFFEALPVVSEQYGCCRKSNENRCVWRTGRMWRLRRHLWNA